MNSQLAKVVGSSTPQSVRAQLAGQLQAHPFLNGLTQAHLLTLAEYATATNFSASEKIFQEGDLANRFYLILEGAVALEVALPDGSGTTIKCRNYAGKTVEMPGLGQDYSLPTQSN